jgi:HSP20 family protein
LGALPDSKEQAMTNLTRTDPVQQLTRFDPFMDLEAFFPFPKMRRWMKDLPAEPVIKLDVTEDDKAYHIKADIPGAKKEDIRVEIEGNQVSLTAEMNRETEEKKGEAVVHSERYYGRQFRSFTLDRDIDREKAVAKFTDGVLELTLPKNGAAPPQRLTIQ